MYIVVLFTLLQLLLLYAINRGMFVYMKCFESKYPASVLVKYSKRALLLILISFIATVISFIMETCIINVSFCRICNIIRGIAVLVGFLSSIKLTKTFDAPESDKTQIKKMVYIMTEAFNCILITVIVDIFLSV